MCLTDIRNSLHRAARAWNKGDLDKFMSHYLKSDYTLLLSDSKAVYGIHAAYESYRESGFGNGKLSFKILEVTPLGFDYAYVAGFYTLTAADSSQTKGSFSLVMQRIEVDGRFRWVVYKDHST